MDWYLWLDDKKDPYEHGAAADMTHAYNYSTFFVWAQNLTQAKFYVNFYGMPARMYLDHDLGANEDGEYEDAMDFLHWLWKEHSDLPPPPYMVISNNTVGKKDIVSFLESWKKSLE